MGDVCSQFQLQWSKLKTLGEVEKCVSQLKRIMSLTRGQVAKDRMRTRSTAERRSFVGAAGKMKEGGDSQKAESIPMGTHGKRSEVGNSWFQPSSSFILNSNKQRIGPIGPKQDGEVWAGGDKAHSIDEEGHRASNSKQERRAQSPLNPRPLVEADLGWERGDNLKGPLSKLGQNREESSPLLRRALYAKKAPLQWERGS